MSSVPAWESAVAFAATFADSKIAAKWIVSRAEFDDMVERRKVSAKDPRMVDHTPNSGGGKDCGPAP